jgi:DNA-binding transcriptional LysR family regulator
MRGPAAATAAAVAGAGIATRQVTERALAGAGVAYRPGMMLGHTEAIRQGVPAGLRVAFVSLCAIQREQATGRLRPPRARGLRIVRHFHVIRHERRPPSTAARVHGALRGSRPGARPARRAVSRARPR